jgi:chromosome segregation ATPase
MPQNNSSPFLERLQEDVRRRESTRSSHSRDLEDVQRRYTDASETHKRSLKKHAEIEHEYELQKRKFEEVEREFKKAQGLCNESETKLATLTRELERASRDFETINKDLERLQRELQEELRRVARDTQKRY